LCLAQRSEGAGRLFYFYHVAFSGGGDYQIAFGSVPRKDFPLNDLDIDAFVKFACPPLFDPLAGMDLSNLFKDVKPMPRRRHRAWTQRDVTRLLRAAKAAGVEVREIMPDGRVILGGPVLATAETDDVILERLR
jgi:hypothetical protein